MRKILNFFIKIFCCLIINKDKRKRVRRALLDYSFLGFIRALKFEATQVRPNSVLLIEFNGSHGETLPGYAKYFIDLGYNVDVLYNDVIHKEKPFCKMSGEKIRLFPFPHGSLLKVSKLEKIKEYCHIFISSSTYYHVDDAFVLDYFKNIKQCNPFVVEHELSYFEKYNEKELVIKKRLITLGDFDKGVFINPHYFGQFLEHNKNDVTTFITVGAINNLRKNHQQLIEAVTLLSAMNKKFKVVVIGRGNIKSLPKKIRAFIEIKGRLNFPQMYDELEKADFLLPLLDADFKEHERYITTGVTGSTQLIYGFKKIPIIHKKFADFYGFDADNALLYEDDLSQAMKTAIDMNSKEYTKKRKDLETLTSKIYAQSIDNLRGTIK